MTAYDGVTIDRDELGNPTDDGTWDYTWEHGRQLASMANSTTTWSFTYDANGLRTSRTNGTATYSYVYNGNQLVQMKKGNDTLYFIYDVTGAPTVVMYNGVPYYYITNQQRDALLLVDSEDNIVVEYAIDSWGNIYSVSGSMATTLGTLNPLIYRGYVYDHETGFYYLQSRYYNPTMGRFINADALVSTGQGVLGNNMFAYCGNNPVCRIDIFGASDSPVTEQLDDVVEMV